MPTPAIPPFPMPSSNPLSDPRPIGILDSGIGGLFILREMRARLPAENMIYVADQAHVPYGTRTIETVRAFTVGIVHFLLAQNAKLIVVACNTASAAALHPLREQFPQVLFVGMEPAVKLAAHDTQTGVIGVIATATTFQSQLYASVVGRFAQDVQVVMQACPDFVQLAERGEVNSPQLHTTARRYLAPLCQQGIDQLVLGCTHFLFLKEAIQAEIGPSITLVDPVPAVAQQAQRVLDAHQVLNYSHTPARVTYYTSGDPVTFRETLRALLGVEGDVYAARWTDAGTLIAGS